MGIRTVDSAAELDQCVELQRRVWRFERRDLVSVGMLAACRDAGGILLGAFDGPQLIGFVFSLPAPRNGQVIQHSHMLAVLRGSRNRGLGYQLKAEQYRLAARLGNRWITWTFEPLESKNAHLNLNRLRVVVRRYFINLYGETTSELHAGLGTDRLFAEWRVDKEGVLPKSHRAAAYNPGDLPQPIQTSQKGLWRIPGETHLELHEPVLAVEIPSEIQKLKKKDPELAISWRQSTRQILDHYLGQGYLIDALLRSQSPERSPRSFYRLRLSKTQPA